MGIELSTLMEKKLNIHSFTHTHTHTHTHTQNLKLWTNSTFQKKTKLLPTAKTTLKQSLAGGFKVCAYLGMYACMRVCACACVLCVHARVCVCVCTCVYVCINIYECMCVLHMNCSFSFSFHFLIRRPLTPHLC